MQRNAENTKVAPQSDSSHFRSTMVFFLISRLDVEILNTVTAASNVVKLHYFFYFSEEKVVKLVKTRNRIGKLRGFPNRDFFFRISNLLIFCFCVYFDLLRGASFERTDHEKREIIRIIRVDKSSFADKNNIYACSHLGLTIFNEMRRGY